MPAPHWIFRFMYDRESAAWERRRDEPEHRELVERIADERKALFSKFSQIDADCDLFEFWVRIRV